MLRNEGLLLSLKTQRYVGLGPTTGEPYSADFTGTTPNRRNGTAFRWEEVKPQKQEKMNMLEKCSDKTNRK